MRRIIATAAAFGFAACAAGSGADPASMDAAAFEREIERRFQYPPPEPAAAVAGNPREGRMADAAYFAAYPDYERAYAPEARAQARELAARLREEAGGLTPDQFTLRVAEIVALADNAHSHVGTAFQKNTRRAPIRTSWFPDGLHVLRAGRDHADLLGARIDAIDGVAVEEVYQRIRRYSGGIEQWRRQTLTAMLESPGLLHAAGVAEDAVALTFSGVMASGAPFARRIEGEVRGQAAPISSPARLVFPVGADNAMPSLLSCDGDLPLYLRDCGELFAVETLPGGGVYIALGYGADTDDEPIADFLARVNDRIARERPHYAVVDLRANTGGDFTTTYQFASDLPAQVEHVYVLTSGWTLSAAMHVAAAIRQAAPERVTLVGAPVGDRLSFWSEGGAFILPNAPMIVSYTAGRHDFGGPCADLDACFWLSAASGEYRVQVRTLDPDIAAPLTFAAYRARRDPAMEAVAEVEVSRRASAAPSGGGR